MSSCDISLASPEDIKAMNSLLSVTEELLFSFPLPLELTTKYEAMKKKVASKLGIQHNSSKIWKMQREAYEKHKLHKKETGVQVDSCKDSVNQLRIFDVEETTNVLCLELLSRLEVSHNTVNSYQEVCNFLVTTFRNITQKLATTLGYNPNLMTYNNQVSSVFEFEIENRHYSIQEIETECAKYSKLLRNIEKTEESFLEKLRQELQNYEVSSLELIERFQELFKHNEALIESLQSECKQLTQKSRDSYKQNQQDLQELRDQLTQEKYQVQDQHQKDIENLRLEHKTQLEELKETYALEITELKSKLQDLEYQKNTFGNHHEQEVSDLHSQIEALKSESKNLKSQIKDLENEKALVTQNLEKANSTLGLQKQKLKELENELTQKEEQIDQLNKDHKNQISTLKAKHSQELEVLTADLDQQKSLTTKLKDLENKYQSTVKFYDESIQKERQVEEDFKQELNQYKSQNQKLQAEVSECTSTLQQVEETLYSIYNKNLNLQKGWNHQEQLEQVVKSGKLNHAELFVYLEFVCVYLQRNLNDNKWLFNQVIDLSKENERLKYLKGSPVKVVTSSKNFHVHKPQVDSKQFLGLSATMKDFEKSREKLLRHFHTSR